MNLALAQPFAITFGLLLLRCGAAFFLIPIFGGTMIPRSIRAGVAAVIALVLALTVGPLAVDGLMEILTAATGELLLGAAIGLALRFLLSTAELAGEIAGLQMGFAFNRLVDPFTGESVAASSRLYGLITLALFLAIDGPLILLSGLGESLRQMPPGEVLGNISLVALFPMISLITEAALRMAAPVMVALLLTNVAIGILARAAPQLNLFVLAFGFTIGIGLLILLLSAGATFDMILVQLRQFPEHLMQVLGEMIDGKG